MNQNPTASEIKKNLEEKLSRYFGAILRDSHGIPDQRVNDHACVVWQKRVEAYYTRKTAMEAESQKP